MSQTHQTFSSNIEKLVFIETELAKEPKNENLKWQKALCLHRLGYREELKILLEEFCRTATSNKKLAKAHFLLAFTEQKLGLSERAYKNLCYLKNMPEELSSAVKNQIDFLFAHTLYSLQHYVECLSYSHTYDELHLLTLLQLEKYDEAVALAPHFSKSTFTLCIAPFVLKSKVIEKAFSTHFKDAISLASIEERNQLHYIHALLQGNFLISPSFNLDSFYQKSAPYYLAASAHKALLENQPLIAKELLEKASTYPEHPPIVERLMGDLTLYFNPLEETSLAFLSSLQEESVSSYLHIASILEDKDPQKWQLFLLYYPNSPFASYAAMKSTYLHLQKGESKEALAFLKSHKELFEDGKPKEPLNVLLALTIEEKDLESLELYLPRLPASDEKNYFTARYLLLKGEDDKAQALLMSLESPLLKTLGLYQYCLNNPHLSPDNYPLDMLSDKELVALYYKRAEYLLATGSYHEAIKLSTQVINSPITSTLRLQAMKIRLAAYEKSGLMNYADKQRVAIEKINHASSSKEQ